MKYELVENKNKSHKKYIKKIISLSDELYILAAFLKKSGLNIIYKDIQEQVNNECEINVLIGLDMFVTDPDALFMLYNTFKNEIYCNLYIYKSKRGTFHPKIYASKRNNKFKILLGSANLTSGGLTNNTEASMFISSKNDDTYADIVKMFERLISSKNCKESSLLNLHQYKKDYEIYTKKITDADQEASVELEEGFVLDLDNIQEYVDEYLAHEEVEEEWELRKEDYKEAKRLLMK